MRIEAIGKHLILKQEKEGEKNLGGIVIPGLKEQPIADVISIGSDVNDTIGDTILPGDKIFYREHVGTIIEFEGENYIILAAIDVLAKLMSGERRNFGS